MSTYDHDSPEAVFEPVLADIQRLLSLDIGRAIRLNLTELQANAYLAQVQDRTLFRNATFVIEVAASKSLTQIQQQFPALCKIGPNTKMKEIVQTHLPGIEIIHMPTPPRPDPRGVRPRLLPPRQVVAAVAGIQRGQRASAFILPAIGPIFSSTSGQSWKIVDEREGRSVRSGGKTVIIPNPGGAPQARSVRAAAAAVAAAGQQPTTTARCRPVAAAVRPAARSRSERLGLTPRPPEMPAGPPPCRRTARSPQAPAQRRAAHSARSRAQCARTPAEFSAANPITQAAAPLLILLGRLRLHIVDMQAVPLMNHVAQRHHRVREEDAWRPACSRKRRRSPNTRCAARPTTSSRTCPAPTAHVWMQYTCWRSSSRCAPRASASSRS